MKYSLAGGDCSSLLIHLQARGKAWINLGLNTRYMWRELIAIVGIKLIAAHCSRLSGGGGDGRNLFLVGNKGPKHGEPVRKCMAAGNTAVGVIKEVMAVGTLSHRFLNLCALLRKMIMRVVTSKLRNTGLI